MRMVCSRKHKRAFTLVELMVSVSIFAMMTALVVAKYGNFNNSVLLTNLAYDVATQIRTAQTYGLSVKSSDGGVFPGSYGIYFNLGNSASHSCAPISNTSFVIYRSIDASGVAGCLDYAVDIVNTFRLKQGATISSLCVGSGGGDCENYSDTSISFKRPDPEAQLSSYCEAGPYSCWTQHPGSNFSANGDYLIITLRSTSGDTRTIMVRKNGQISVGN